ncbi:MAG: PAS domain S-box protein [Proteobacteria bacterium]|nr:PAS domain S-box protein [Pseudomonadota bacterium]
MPPTTLPPEWLAAIIEQTAEAVIFIDTDGRIRIWNAACTSVFGYPAEEALGQSVDLIIPERFRRAHWEAFDRAVANGRTRGGASVRTTRSMHKDGHKIYLEISFSLVTGDNGVVIGSVAVGRDCTEKFLASKGEAGA